MHFLSQTRTHLVAGLAVLAVAVGAGATAAPASAATAFCNAARPTYYTAYAQCQIAQYNVWVRARALCRSGQVASSNWAVLGANTNWFIGRNFRPNWNSYGFEPLLCSSGVRKVYVEGSWYNPNYGYIFAIPVT